MRPILLRYGGDFRYDVAGGEVLRSDSPHPINRMFTIWFPSRAAKENFFADKEYLAVRKEFFDTAVSGITTIAEYAR